MVELITTYPRVEVFGEPQQKLDLPLLSRRSERMPGKASSPGTSQFPFLMPMVPSIYLLGYTSR